MRALRRLPVKRGGKLSARYAVIVDGEKIGEVLQTRRYGLWYAKPNGARHLGCDLPSRQKAAVVVCREAGKGVRPEDASVKGWF
jgi:hypothetical protein